MGEDAVVEIEHASLLNGVTNRAGEERTSLIEQELAVRSQIEAYTGTHGTDPGETPFDIENP